MDVLKGFFTAVFDIGLIWLYLGWSFSAFTHKETKVKTDQWSTNFMCVKEIPLLFLKRCFQMKFLKHIFFGITWNHYQSEMNSRKKSNKSSTAQNRCGPSTGLQNLNQPWRSVLIFMSFFDVTLPQNFSVSRNCCHIEQEKHYENSRCSFLFKKTKLYETWRGYHKNFSFGVFLEKNVFAWEEHREDIRNKIFFKKIGVYREGIVFCLTVPKNVVVVPFCVQKKLCFLKNFCKLKVIKILSSEKI